ncbi:MAG: radical SAM protein [Solidesulfovibrio sp.]
MAARKKVVLFNPPPNPETGSQLNLESLGLGYLAASMRREIGKTHDVVLWDCSIVDKTMAHIAQVLETMAPDYIGISLSAMNAYQGVILAELVKRHRPQAKILIGGILASSLTTEELACFKPDAILRGEGETLVLNALEMLEDASPSHPFELVQDRPLEVDAIAWPARDMLRWQLKLHPQASIAASRGCPYHCSFCSIPKVGSIRKWRPRDIDDVVEEMVYLYKNYNVVHFYFVDDNFIINTRSSFQRTERFAKLVRDKLPPIRFGFMCRSSAIDKVLLKILKTAGLAGVFLGIESFSQPVLDRYKKRETVEEHIRAIATLNELCITVNPGFIFFDPWTQASEIHDTIQVMKKIDFPSLQSINSKLTCYRGTDIEQQLEGVEESESRLGITGYSIKDAHTKKVLQECYTIFHDYLIPDKDYLEYQHLQYALGYLQPYFLNTELETRFREYYSECKFLWQSGDTIILHWINDYACEKIPAGETIATIIDHHSRENWRKGNDLAKRFIHTAENFLMQTIAYGSCEAARLAILAFTLPGGILRMGNVVNYFLANTGKNGAVIAQALTYNCDFELDDYLRHLVQADSNDAIMDVIESACLTFNFSAIETLERYLVEMNKSDIDPIKESLNNAKRLFHSTYTEFILAKAQ